MGHLSHWTALRLLHGLWIPFNSIIGVSHAGDKAIKPHVRSIDGAFAGEQECVVQEATESAAHERRHHWNLEFLEDVAVMDNKEDLTQK